MTRFARLRRWYLDMVQPDVIIDRDHGGIERWDGDGVGPGRSIAFEGFGISFSLFFGRLPRPGAGKP